MVIQLPLLDEKDRREFPVLKLDRMQPSMASDDVILITPTVLLQILDTQDDIGDIKCPPFPSV